MKIINRHKAIFVILFTIIIFSCSKADETKTLPTEMQQVNVDGNNDSNEKGSLKNYKIVSSFPIAEYQLEVVEFTRAEVKNLMSFESKISKLRDAVGASSQTELLELKQFATEINVEAAVKDKFLAAIEQMMPVIDGVEIKYQEAMQKNDDSYPSLVRRYKHIRATIADYNKDENISPAVERYDQSYENYAKASKIDKQSDETKRLLAQFRLAEKEIATLREQYPLNEPRMTPLDIFDAKNVEARLRNLKKSIQAYTPKKHIMDRYKFSFYIIRDEIDAVRFSASDLYRKAIAAYLIANGHHNDVKLNDTNELKEDTLAFTVLSTTVYNETTNRTHLTVFTDQTQIEGLTNVQLDATKFDSVHKMNWLQGFKNGYHRNRLQIEQDITK